MCYRETAHYVVLCDRCGLAAPEGDRLVDALDRGPGRPRSGVGDDRDRAPVPDMPDRRRHRRGRGRRRRTSCSPATWRSAEATGRLLVLARICRSALMGGVAVRDTTGIEWADAESSASRSSTPASTVSP